MIRNNPAHDVLTPPGTVHSDMGPLTRSIDDFQEQVRDYYERRQHMNTTQRGKLAEELRKADAPQVSTSIEERAYRLIKALHAHADVIENSPYLECTNSWYATQLRKILSENS